MTNDQLLALYKEAYTSKEAASLGTVLGWFPNLVKGIHSRTQVLPGLKALGKNLWSRPVVRGLVKYGVLPGTAVYGGLEGYKYYKNQVDDHWITKTQKWIKDNPWQAGAIAAGLITSPLWMPAVSNAIMGGSRETPIRMGADNSGYQMGYYPGR